MGLTNEAKLDFWNNTWDKHGAWLNNRSFKLKLIFEIALIFKIFLFNCLRKGYFEKYIDEIIGLNDLG